ncbi:diadenosine tetraphosphate asymmetrical hydrolase [Flammula alnicola]|nr:diadenosine tetraphosphate asymmetrical hydrolase [Flammula alnicola]
MTPLLFSTFEVTSQAFYRASKSYAIVNLKPIVPGHVLVIPSRPVPRLADLDDKELACLMQSVKRVGSVIEKVYGGDGLTIACQDGKAAGQTVPHVHFHLLPRKFQGDPFSEKNDEIYPELENNEGSLKSNLIASSPTHAVHTHLQVDADEDRKPRTVQEMEKEADYLKGFFRETSGTN